MNVTDRVEAQCDEKETCTIVVIYEDALTRQRAMAVCDFLMQQLWSEVEFDFHWWRADFLNHPIMADTAAQQAMQADFVIFCSSAESDCSPTVKQWFESWVGARRGRDGVLLNLTTSCSRTADHDRPVEIFLRDAARRAALDYFAAGPPTLTGTLPASFEEAERRACKISSVLDEILNQPPRPPSFGLND